MLRYATDHRYLSRFEGLLPHRPGYIIEQLFPNAKKILDGMPNVVHNRHI